MNDIVLLVDDNISSMQWLLGIVTQVIVVPIIRSELLLLKLKMEFFVDPFPSCVNLLLHIDIYNYNSLYMNEINLNIYYTF